MRVLSVLLVLFLTPCGLAQEAERQKAARPPWAWNAEDRLRERFDPRAVEARMARERSKFRQLAPDALVINGRETPELLFPTELMDLLLIQMSEGTPGEINNAKEIYRRDLEALGWEFDSFWNTVSQAADKYFVTRRLFTDLQRQSLGKRPTGPEREFLTRDLCRARAAALAQARRQFGGESFDRFLYTAVAPTVLASFTPKTDPTTLRQLERGCQ